MRTYIRNCVPRGRFFLTLCLEDRTQQLLTDHIEAFRQAFRETRAKHFFTLHGMVVLPDHIHMLIRLPENNSDCAVIVSSLKALFSRSLPSGETSAPAANANGSAAFGSGVIGSTPFATSAILPTTWTTSISIP